MKTIVSLEGIEFFAYHGYYSEERITGTTFICDVSVHLNSFESIDDNIDDTVNYEEIYEIVKEEMSQTKKLIETVAFNIIKKLKVIDNVTAGSFKIRKVSPPIKGNIKQAVVEMHF